MSDSANPPASLIMIQFLSWIADRPRPRRETMDAWRSTCPRLSVWEDAVIDELVRIEKDAVGTVCLTPRGRAALERSQTRIPAPVQAPEQPRQAKTRKPSEAAA